MKRSSVLLRQPGAVPLLLLMLPLPALAAPALNVTLGTTGLGVEWDQPLHSKLHLRAVASYGKLDRDEESDDIEYDAELTVGGAALLLDWHPFSGGFRVSTGLSITALDLSLDADAN